MNINQEPSQPSLSYNTLPARPPDLAIALTIFIWVHGITVLESCALIADNVWQSSFGPFSIIVAWAAFLGFITAFIGFAMSALGLPRMHKSARCLWALFDLAYMGAIVAIIVYDSHHPERRW